MILDDTEHALVVATIPLATYTAERGGVEVADHGTGSCACPDAAIGILEGAVEDEISLLVRSGTGELDAIVAVEADISGGPYIAEAIFGQATHCRATGRVGHGACELDMLERVACGVVVDEAT